MSPLDAVKTIKNRFFPRDTLPGVLSPIEMKRLNALPIKAEGVVEIYGVPIRFSDKNGLLHSLREIFVEDVYRFESTSPSPLIVDLGANIGLSVLYFRRLFPTSRIIAYEPDPDIYPLLEENIRGMGAGIDARNAAAWIEDSVLTFYKEGSLAGSTEVDADGLGDSCSVRSERLRNTLAEYDVIDFLKVDVEGAENSLMFDLEDVLPKVGNLFLEYHGIPGVRQRLGDLLNLISDAGFQYAIRNANPCIHLPFVEDPVTTFDPQLNIFCHRRTGRLS